MNTITVELNGKEVVIKAIPFRKVLEVLKYIKTLPEKVKGSLAGIDTKNIKSLDNTVTLGIFAELISDSSDEILDILSVASGLPAKEVGDLSIIDITKLFKVLLEVNNIDEIKKEFGELGRMFNKKA